MNKSSIVLTAALVILILSMSGCMCAPKRDVPGQTATAVAQTPQATATTEVAPTVATPASTTTAPAPTPLPTGPAPTDAAPSGDYVGLEKKGGTLGDTWTLVDVRVGAHPDRFRVVVEMRESRERAPWYEIVEVDNAADPFPTGHDPTWGSARIDLVISDLYLYDFPIAERLPIPAPENPVVTRVGYYPTESDAHVGFSIGLKEPAAYQAYWLEEPIRIVVDVLYP